MKWQILFYDKKKKKKKKRKKERKKINLSSADFAHSVLSVNYNVFAPFPIYQS